MKTDSLVRYSHVSPDLTLTGKITEGLNRKDTKTRKNEYIVEWNIEKLTTDINSDDFRTTISRDDPSTFDQLKTARMEYDKCKGKERGRGRNKQKKKNDNTNKSIPKPRAASDYQVHSETTAVTPNRKDI